MLMPDIALAVVVFGPLALTYFLKSNAGLGFLALCAGFVLGTSIIGDLERLLSQKDLTLTGNTIGLILILVPFLGTLLFGRRTHSKGFMFVLQCAAAVCAGGLLALSLGPLLTTSAEFDITNSSLWDDLLNIQAGVIGVGALLSLLLVWSPNFKRPKKH